MKPMEITPTGTLRINVAGGDVVARGEQRHTVRLEAPGAPEEVAAKAVSVTEDLTTVELPGPLTLRVPLDLALELHGRMDDVVLRNVGTVFLAECRGDLVASEVAALVVGGTVRGDVALRKIAGDVQMQAIHGDMAVAQVTRLVVETIAGDISLTHVEHFQCSQVAGDMSATHSETVAIGNVGGDVVLNSVRGEAALDVIGGDLVVNTPGQTLAVPDIRGDAVLRGPVQPEGSYRLRAGGDVVLTISGDAQLSVQGQGDVVLGDDLDHTASEAGVVSATMGESERAALIRVEAGGDVVVNSSRRSHRYHNRMVDAELRRAMSEVQSELKRAARTVQREVDQMHQHRSAAGYEREIAAATGSSVHEIVRDLLDSLDPEKPSPPATTRALPRADSEELRMILEMLESGAITAEEAEKLIEALKG